MVHGQHCILVERLSLTCWACLVLPIHSHLSVTRLSERLKELRKLILYGQARGDTGVVYRIRHLSWLILLDCAKLAFTSTVSFHKKRSNFERGDVLRSQLTITGHRSGIPCTGSVLLGKPQPFASSRAYFPPI